MYGIMSFLSTDSWIVGLVKVEGKPAIAAMHSPHSLVRFGAKGPPVLVRSGKCTAKIGTQLANMYDSINLM